MFEMISRALTQDAILPVWLRKLTTNRNCIQFIHSGPDQQQYQLEFTVETLYLTEFF